MLVRSVIFSLLFLVANIVVAEQPIAAESNLSESDSACQVSNAALQAMGRGQVTFTFADGTQQQVAVRVADDNQTRAAGFQYVCAETIVELPILFIFQRAVKPRFHMNNVVAPIDIAFIDPEGQIDSIQQMQPYTIVSLEKPLYSPSKKVIAALETKPDFYSEHSIDRSTMVSWTILKE